MGIAEQVYLERAERRRLGLPPRPPVQFPPLMPAANIGRTRWGLLRWLLSLAADVLAVYFAGVAFNWW